MKKIALVDIDGCLIQNGKLNLDLVKKLQEYDEVILFTQRSKYIQTGQLPRHYFSNPDSTSIVTTPQAVDALQERTHKTVRVSTSLDPYFGEPTEYFERELRSFESRMQKALIAHVAVHPDDPFERGTFNDEYESEVSSVRKALKQEENVPPDRFYPIGKVEQYIHLTKSLQSSSECSIDYFDDRSANMQEILDAGDMLPITPQCILVDKHNLQLFVPHAPDDKHPSIKAFNDYIKARQDEVNSSGGKQYHTIWARLFKPDVSAANKISAAEKCIHLLSGKQDVSFSKEELKALQDKRLGNLFKEHHANHEELTTHKDLKEIAGTYKQQMAALKGPSKETELTFKAKEGDNEEFRLK